LQVIFESVKSFLSKNNNFINIWEYRFSCFIIIIVSFGISNIFEGQISLPYIHGIIDQLSKILAKRRLKLSSVITKPSNNYSEALKIYLTHCSVMMSIKIPIPVTNNTLVKLVSSSKHVSRNIFLTPFISAYLRSQSLNILIALNI